jgi:hypothetical protein
MSTEIRETIEWVSIRWHDAPDKKSKRVLLIGDSIVVGHGTKAHDLLKKKICVDHFATSKHVTDVEFASDLEFMLAKQKYELILFNNGLHGFDIADELYPAALREMLAELKKRTPILAWRSCTPILDKENPAQLNPDRNPRVLRRNADALKISGELGLPTLDMYSPMAENKKLFSPDCVHFTEQGQDAQAQLLADFVCRQLSI